MCVYVHAWTFFGGRCGLLVVHACGGVYAHVHMCVGDVPLYVHSTERYFLDGRLMLLLHNGLNQERMWPTN